MAKLESGGSSFDLPPVKLSSSFCGEAFPHLSLLMLLPRHGFWVHSIIVHTGFSFPIFGQQNPPFFPPLGSPLFIRVHPHTQGLPLAIPAVNCSELRGGGCPPPLHAIDPIPVLAYLVPLKSALSFLSSALSTGFRPSPLQRKRPNKPSLSSGGAVRLCRVTLKLFPFLGHALSPYGRTLRGFSLFFLRLLPPHLS